MQTAVANEQTKINYVCLYTERTSLLYYNFFVFLQRNGNRKSRWKIKCNLFFDLETSLSYHAWNRQIYRASWEKYVN